MNNSDSWKDVYDTSDFGNKYASSYLVSLFHTRIKKILPDPTKGLETKNVLDFGCSIGANSKIFTDLGINTYGIDVSETAIRRLIEAGVGDDQHFKVVNLLEDNMSIEKVFGDVSFDLIIASEIMYYFTNRELETMIKKFMDSMKNGAILYASVPTYDFSLYNSFKEIPKNSDGMVEVKESGSIKKSLWVNLPRNEDEMRDMFLPLEIIDLLTVSTPMHSGADMIEYHILARK